jgi:hypothetical protein
VAFSSGQQSITTTRSLIHQADADGCKLTLSLDVGAGTHVYIGNGTVTTSTGFIFDGAQVMQLQLSAGDAVYGVTTSGTIALSKIVID